MGHESLRLQREIAETLERLDRTVDEIAAKADVSRHVHERIDETVAGVREELNDAESYDANALLRAFGAGAVTGLRSMTGPATAFRNPRNTPVSRVLPALAFMELVVDKFPNVPSRTAAPQLAFRLLAGTITGAGVASARGANRYAGALAGAAGALAASYAGAAYRRFCAERHVPSVVAALLEDAVAISAGLAIAKAPAV